MLRHPSSLPRFAAILIFAFLACAGIAFVSEVHASQQEQQAPRHLIPSLKGPELYQSYCAACHGKDGHGRGPTAAVLKSAVPDLTTIARRNKGTFPRDGVRTTIAGDDRPVAHGTREMPLWGPIFSQIENDTDYGSVRLENVVLYLESIQVK
jgi:hypothetical protein